MSHFTAAVIGAVVLLAACATGKPRVEVWKSASCGCCLDWVRHLEANGFEVRVSNVDEPARYRMKLGIPARLGAWHSASIPAYALEGHAPAREIRRMLTQRPEAIALAVPAMPVGSPGMDGNEYGGRQDAYDVLLITRGGEARVCPSYR